jgi:hypothetical protein
MHTDYRRPLKALEMTISAVVGLAFCRTACSPSGADAERLLSLAMDANGGYLTNSVSSVQRAITDSTANCSRATCSVHSSPVCVATFLIPANAP